MKNKILRLLSLFLVICTVASVIVLPASAEDMRSILDLDIAGVGKIYFKGETDKDFTTYKVGEEMVFTMTLYADGEQITAPYFSYNIVADDGTSSSGYVDAKSGTAQIRTSISVAGAVRLTVNPCDARKNVIKDDNGIITPFEGGAIANAEDVKLVAAEPSDFDAFWERQLALLDECAPDPISIEQVDSGNNKFVSYIIKINCIGNPDQIATRATWVAGVLTMPKNAEKGSLKLRLGFQGYGVTSASVNPVANTAYFSVCAHSMEQLRSESYYDKSSLGLDNYGFSKTENANPETCYFKNMLLRDVQAVRFLRKYFGETGVSSTVDGVDTSAWQGLWNGVDLETAGGSQGGFQSIAVAGLVPEVTVCTPNVPWFANLATETDPTKFRPTFYPNYVDGLRYFDAASFAKRIKGKVNMTAGTGDALCPMFTTQTIFNNLNTEASFTFRQGKKHGTTNTYPIDMTQYKMPEIGIGDEYTLPFEIASVSDENVVAKTSSKVITGLKAGSVEITFTNGIKRTYNVVKQTADIFTVSGNIDASSAEYAEFKAAFADTWKSYTGNAALFDGEDTSAHDAKSQNALIICDTTAAPASDGEEEIKNAYALFDNVAVVLAGDRSTSDYHRTLIDLCYDADSKFCLSGFGGTDYAVLGKAAAEQLYCSLLGTETDSVTMEAVLEDGSSAGDFIATGTAAVVPYTVPLYMAKYEGFSQNTITETGEDYDIIRITGKHVSKDIKVYSSAVASGEGWIITESGKLIVYPDFVCGWNGYIDSVTSIEVKEGVKTLSENAFALGNDGIEVKLPYSLESIDAGTFGGKKISVVSYDGTAGETFAAENSLPFTSLGDAGDCGMDVFWFYKDGVLTISGTGTTPEVKINGWGKPETSPWYKYYDNIEKIVVDENVTTLSGACFHYMGKTKFVEITPNLKKLSGTVFETMGNLVSIYYKGETPVTGEANIRFVDNLTLNYTFDGCGKLRSFVLSDKAAGTIGTEAFKGTSVVELTVPVGIRGISALAFSNASLIKKLTVLGENTEINEYAFANSTNKSAGNYRNYINNVTICAYDGSAAQKFAEDNMMKYHSLTTGLDRDYSEIEGYETVKSGNIGTGVRYSVVKASAGKYELIFTGNGSKTDSFASSSEQPWDEYRDGIVCATIMCKDLTDIGDFVLADLPNLETLLITDALVAFGKGALMNSGVRTIYISAAEEGTADVSGIYEIGESCFEGTKFTSVRLGKGMTEIAPRAFASSALTVLEIPKSVTMIGDSAFENSASLGNVTVYSQEITVGTDAFAGLPAGASLSAYGDLGFEEICDANGYTFVSLGEVPHTVEGQITNTWNGQLTVNNTWIFDYRKNILTIKSNKDTGWNECGNLYSTGYWKNYVNSIEEVIIEGNHGKVTQSAFQNYTNLKKVTYTGCAEIDGNAFRDAAMLSQIMIAGSVDITGTADFTNVKTLGSKGNILYGTAIKGVILGNQYSESNPIMKSNFPSGLEAIYGTGEYLESLAAELGVEFIPFGKGAGSVYWTVKDGVLTVYGEGSIDGLSNIARFASDINSVVVGAGVKAIGDGAFAELGTLEKATFLGNAPTAGANIFGTQGKDFYVECNAGASGFNGSKWNGYTLKKPSVDFVAGDVNGDGTVDTKDSVLLSQYLAGWDVTISIRASDCNGDGTVDTKDSVLLSQYLAGWDVKLVGGKAKDPDDGGSKGDIEIDESEVY